MANSLSRINSSGVLSTNYSTFDETQTLTNAGRTVAERVTSTSYNISGILDETQTLTYNTKSVAKRIDSNGNLYLSGYLDENTDFTSINIVNDASLVQWLDAANPISYPGTGTKWYDITGYNDDLTLNALTTYSTDYGGAIIASGSSSIASNTSITNLNITTAFTVSIWLYPTIVDGTIKRFLNFNTNSIQLRYDGVNGAQQIHFYATIGGTLNQLRVNGQVIQNTVQNYIGTYDGTTMKLYKNGTQIGGDLTVFGSTNIVQTVSSEIIGSNGSGAEAFDGNIYNVQIYNRGLSATEVTQNFNAYRDRFGI